MAQFIGRERELAALEEMWARPNAQFLVTYGRRRTGKTALRIDVDHLKPASKPAETAQGQPQRGHQQQREPARHVRPEHAGQRHQTGQQHQRQPEPAWTRRHA